MSRGREKGIGCPAGMVYGAYLRWLTTQGEQVRPGQPWYAPDGWLITLPELHAWRAPGRTCLTALGSGRMGTLEEPINHSKGCGGVMRAAPAGMVRDFPVGAFELGCQTAAITHGHPSGYLPAGLLAEIIRQIMEGVSLREALEAGLLLLPGREGSRETLQAVRLAVRLAESTREPAEPIRHVENIGRIGEGWVGEEALAIAVYCCLVAGEDLPKALLLAVNHSGDSDSTGAIAGNILGAYLGREALPPEWLVKLELQEAMATVAVDLLAGWREGDDWWRRYPGY
jgi:ADP-ribosylglycohydrolase